LARKKQRNQRPVVEKLPARGDAHTGRFTRSRIKKKSFIDVLRKKKTWTIPEKKVYIAGTQRIVPPQVFQGDLGVRGESEGPRN